MTALYWGEKYLRDEGVEKELHQLEGDLECVKLWLCRNSLSDSPHLTNFRQFEGLKLLDLSYNDIETLTVGNIPPTTEILVLYNN